MRNLVKRLKKEKATIESSLINTTKVGIPANEILEMERKLNRIETILSGIKENTGKYLSLMRIESIKRKERAKEPTM